MLALPESRILLAGMPREGRHEPLARWFEAEGIAPERLQFRRRCADHTYLELHHQIDIALDPFPFTGATTTSNALWMGVPTLTLTGRTVAGRLGPALLEHAGLADFVAHTPQDFVAKGIYWARHLDQLADAPRQHARALPLPPHRAARRRRRGPLQRLPPDVAQLVRGDALDHPRKGHHNEIEILPPQ